MPVRRFSINRVLATLGASALAFTLAAAPVGAATEDGPTPAPTATPAVDVLPPDIVAPTDEPAPAPSETPAATPSAPEESIAEPSPTEIPADIPMSGQQALAPEAVTPQATEDPALLDSEEDSREGEIDLEAIPFGSDTIQAFSLRTASAQATATGLPAHPHVRFAAPTQIGWNWPSSGVVIAGDWDRNGHSDMLLRRADGTLWFYPATSSTRFGSARQIGHGWGSFDLLFSGIDFDRDGNLDLIARRADGKLYAYYGNGRGGFRSSAQIGNGWGVMRSITAMTSSVNGQAALLATDRSGRMYIYPTTGSGFAAPIALGYGWGGMRHIVGSGDWDGNGRSDFIAVDANGYLRLYAASSSATSFSGYQIGNGWGGATTIGTTKQTSTGTTIHAILGGRLMSYPVTTRPAPTPPPVSIEPGTEVPYSASGRTYIAPGSAPGSGLGSTVVYRVEVEIGLPVNVEAFASEVHTILNDSRGWRRNFVRTDGATTIRLILASPTLVDRLCAPLDTGGYTSCRVGNNVVINAHRWAYNAAPFANAGGSLALYRQYVINHEMGHAIGNRHVQCPGAGRLAPIMQQQTLYVEPCRPNGWPNP